MNRLVQEQLKMGLKVKITGNEAVIKGLKKQIANITDIVEDEITETTYNIAAKAESKAPANLGGLRNSITPDVKREKNVIIGQVEAKRKYAAYVEFGTGGMVDVPQGLEDYAIQFKGNNVREVNLPARPFLFPAFFEEVKLLGERLKKQLNGGKSSS